MTKDVGELLDKGRLFRSMGDPSTAARYLTEAAELAPSNGAVLVELALAHFASAALPSAEAVARTLVEKDPSDAYARRLLGLALARQSRHAEALAELRMAAVMTDDPAVHAEVAKAEQHIARRAAAGLS